MCVKMEAEGATMEPQGHPKCQRDTTRPCKVPQRHPQVPTTSTTRHKQPMTHPIKQRHTHKHTRTHTNTQTHKHTNTQPHTNTQTHTHTHNTQHTKQTPPTQQTSNPNIPRPGARRRRRRSGRGLEGRAHQAARRRPRSGAEAGIRGTNNKIFVLEVR